MPKIIYRTLAEITWIIHGVIFVTWIMFGLLWQELFWYYIIAFPIWVSSWIFFHRCIITDLENYLRVRWWQDISQTKKSFLGYWGVKIFWKHGPSNTTILYIICGFYIIVTPIWVYTLYVYYLYSI